MNWLISMLVFISKWSSSSLKSMSRPHGYSQSDWLTLGLTAEPTPTYRAADFDIIKACPLIFMVVHHHDAVFLLWTPLCLQVEPHLLAQRMHANSWKQAISSYWDDHWPHLPHTHTKQALLQDSMWLTNTLQHIISVNKNFCLKLWLYHSKPQNCLASWKASHTLSTSSNPNLKNRVLCILKPFFFYRFL